MNKDISKSITFFFPKHSVASLTKNEEIVQFIHPECLAVVKENKFLTKEELIPFREKQKKWIADHRQEYAEWLLNNAPNGDITTCAQSLRSEEPETLFMMTDRFIIDENNQYKYNTSYAAAIALMFMGEIDKVIRIMTVRVNGISCDCVATSNESQIKLVKSCEMNNSSSIHDDTNLINSYIETELKYGDVKYNGSIHAKYKNNHVEVKKELKVKAVKCYIVRYETCERISDKAVKITCFDGSSSVIPLSQCFGFSESGKSDSVYITEWFLNKQKVNIQYSTHKTAWFDKKTGAKIA